MKMFSILLFTGLLAFAAGRICAGPCGIDPSFDPGSTVDDLVYDIAVQADGKVLIGGIFEGVHSLMQPRLARLHADGTTDATFRVAVSGGNAVVAALLIQPDGRIVAGGYFTNVNGIARQGLVRLHPDGSLDSTFLGRADGRVRAMVRQNDGKLLIVGEFTNVSGFDRPYLARLNEDGSLDTTFLAGLAGPSSEPSDLVVQSDGRILIGGWFASVNGIAQPKLARLNVDGSLDDSFRPSIEGDGVRAVAIQANGKILVGGVGSFTVNGVQRPGLARLNPDGTLDDSFVPGVQVSNGVNGLSVQPDQKILVHGVLRWTGSQDFEGVARLHENGARDESFAAHADAGDFMGVWSLALQSDGKIFIAGGQQYCPIPPYLLRLNPDGSEDDGFGNGPAGPDSKVNALARQTDGKLLIGGAFARMNGLPQGGIARLNTDGSHDTNYLTLRAGTDRSVLALALQPDGKCLIGGEFRTINGLARTALARLNTDGTVDTTFLPGLMGMFSYVYSLAVQPDGKIVIGGYFSSIGGIQQAHLARLFTDGSLDTSFQPQLGEEVHTMVLQADGKIIIGGTFSTVNYVARKNLARLNADGSLDLEFLNGMTGLDQTPWSLAVQEDGKILVTGWFSAVNNVSRNGLARLNTDGSLDQSFLGGTQFSSKCSGWALALQADRRILVGGVLPFADAKRHVARLNSDRSLDSTFVGPDMDPNREVYSILIQPDTGIVIAGDFTRLGQIPRSHVARLRDAIEPPVIVSQPRPQTAEAGSTVYFRVQAESPSPLTYYWCLDETNTLCATADPGLQLDNVQGNHCGLYSVVVSNLAGTVNSAPAALQVVAPVERRRVPGLTITSAVGATINVESAASLEPASVWSALDTVTMNGNVQNFFDLSQPLPARRFYRARGQDALLSPPSLAMHSVPAITLSGELGSAIRVDGINQSGPTDAWFTLDTVTLTNTSQLFFDVNSIGQPARLYRLVPIP